MVEWFYKKVVYRIPRRKSIQCRTMQVISYIATHACNPVHDRKAQTLYGTKCVPCSRARAYVARQPIMASGLYFFGLWGGCDIWQYFRPAKHGISPPLVFNIIRHLTKWSLAHSPYSLGSHVSQMVIAKIQQDTKCFGVSCDAIFLAIGSAEHTLNCPETRTCAKIK